MNKRRKSRNKTRSWYVWHRYSGIFAATFVIIITISGIALNHTDALNLNKTHLNSNWLLAHYNVKQPSNIISYPVGRKLVTQVDELLFVDDQLISETHSKLLGAVRFNAFTIAAFQDQLLLIDENHTVVETLSSADNLPSNITHIGVSKQQVVVTANQKIYLLSNSLQLTDASPATAIWSTAQALQTEQAQHIINTYRSNIINVETFILDLHSGRFFGQYGTLLFDFVGMVFLFLAFSGLYIWLKQRTKHT